MGKSRRKNQGANQDQSASSSASSQVDSNGQESSEQAASPELQSSPATGAGPAAAAQAQMLGIAQTQGNAAAQEAMQSTLAGSAQEEEGGHATEGSEEDAGSDGVEKDSSDRPAQESSEEATGDAPGEPPDVPGGEPNPSDDEAGDPELNAQEEASEEGSGDAEGEQEEAESVAVEAAGAALSGVATPPLMPTKTPSLGLSSQAAVRFSLPSDQDEALVLQTGMDAAAHLSEANATLDSLSGTALSLQAEIVQEAQTRGAEIRAGIEGLLPGVDQVAASTSEQVGQSFDAGVASIQSVAIGAQAGVDAALLETQAGIAARHAQGTATVDAIANATQAELTGKEQSYSESFNTLEMDYAAQFEQAPKDAASDILSQKKAIGQEQKTGAGGAIERVLDQKRAQAGEILAEKAAEKISVEGEVVTPAPVEALQESMVVQDWMVPLQDRVGTFQEEGKSVLDATSEDAQSEISAGGEAWKADVAANEEASVAQMEQGKAEAQSEVHAVGTQLHDDIQSQAISQESLFVEASSEMAESYRSHMEVVSSHMAGLPFLSAEQALEYAAGQQESLETLHAQNLETLSTLEDSVSTQVGDHVEASHQTLLELLAQNQGDIESTTLENVAAFEEMGLVYGDSLKLTGVSVEAEMEAWVAPMDAQNQVFTGEVEAQLQTRHSEAEEGLEGALQEQIGTLEEEAAEVGDHIDAEPVTEETRATLREICEKSLDAMEGWGTDENQLFNALRKIEDRSKTPNYSAAVEEKWTDINGSSIGSLDYWMEDDLTDREYKIGRKYYEGKTAEAAALELDYCTAWYNDDEAQIETVLRTLSPEQRTEMQNVDGWAEVHSELQSDLDGTDLDVVDALLVNNVARADAYRLRDKINDARRSGDHDALHTALGGMDPALREQIAQEFSYIQTDGAVAGAEGVELPDVDSSLNALADYATRDIEGQYYNQHTGETHTYVKHSISGANEDLARAQILHGNDALETDVARFEVERTRSGGPKEANMEEALYMSAGAQDQLRRGETDRDLQAAIARAEQVLGATAEENFGTHEQSALEQAGLPKAYVEAIIERRERAGFSQLYQEKYGNENGLGSAEDAIRDLYKNSDDSALEIEAHIEMMEAGTNSPKVVALLTEITTNDAGTQDERLQRAWNNLTPEEADQAQEIWETRSDLGNGESLEDFFFNDTFSELSGDDAREMKEKMMGSETYMNDSEKVELAAFRHDYHVGSGGSLHEQNLARHFKELRELEATVAARSENNGSAYDVEGYFLGSAEEKIRHAELCAYVGITVRQEMAREDRMADAWGTAIAIVGGAIVIVLTAGAATPLVIGAATLATGAAGMAANYAIKGDRYGYEQAMLDGGVTVASALTAGYGAHLSRLNDVAKGGTGIVLAGRTLSQNTGKIYISVVTAGGDSFVGAVLNDQTWEESGGGWSDVLLATAKGAGMDYAGGFIGDAVEGFKPISKIAGEGSSTAAHLTQDAVKGYVEDFLKEGLSLGFDKATGKYQGDFGDILVAMNEAGMKGAGTGMLNGFVQRATPENVFEGTRLGEVGEEGPTKSIGDALGEVTGLVAKHPDVVEQLDQLEASEEASSEKAEQDDSEQAARIEEVGGEETPEELAQTLEDVSQEKEAMVEERSQQGQEEIETLVQVVSDTEKTVESEVDAEAKKAMDAMENASAEGPETASSTANQSPALSDAEVANTVFESLNLTPEAVDHFNMLHEHEVAALVEYHKVHGDAGEVLKDAGRVDAVLGISTEERSVRPQSLQAEDPDATVIIQRNTDDLDETVIIDRGSVGDEETELIHREEVLEPARELTQEEMGTFYSDEEVLEPARELTQEEMGTFYPDEEVLEPARELTQEEMGTFYDQAPDEKSSADDTEKAAPLPDEFSPLDISEDLPGAVGIDERGLMHGDGYLEEQAKLREHFMAYNSRSVQGHMAETDGPGNTGKVVYATKYAHDVSEGDSVTTVVQRLYLNLDSDVSPEDRAHAIQQIHAGVDKVYNAPGHQVSAAHGGMNTLQVKVEIVDTPGDAHYTVNLKNQQGSGRADAANYYVWDDKHVHAHEGFHNIFGGVDEYADPAVPYRDVHNDQGIMSNNPFDYSTHDPSKIMHPGEDGQYGTKDDVHYIAYHENVGLRDRNLAHIEDIIAQSRQTEGNWQTASQTAVDAHEQAFVSQQEDRRSKYEYELEVGKTLPTMDDLGSYQDLDGVTEVWHEGEAWQVRRLLGDEGESVYFFNDAGDAKGFSRDEFDGKAHQDRSGSTSESQDIEHLEGAQEIAFPADTQLVEEASDTESGDTKKEGTLWDDLASFLGMGSAPKSLDPSSPDYDEKTAKVVGEMGDDGSAVAVEILRRESDPKKRADLAHHFEVLHELTKRPVDTLTDDEVISVVRANHALVQQYKADQTLLRRVVGDNEIGTWLRGEEFAGMKNGKAQFVDADQSRTSGSIGLAQNTQGMSVQDMISVLGLDYNDDAYVKKTADGYVAKDSLFFVETKMTTEMVEKAKVPIGSDVYARIEKLAASDPQARDLLKHIRADDIGKESGDQGHGRDGLNPYTGVGITAPSDRLRDGRHAVAPELKMNDKVSLPAGSKLYHQTNDGTPVLVAEYKQSSDGRFHWEVSSDCPAELRERAEKLAKKESG